MNFQHLPKIGKISLSIGALLIVAIIFLLWPKNNKSDIQKNAEIKLSSDKTIEEMTPVKNFLENFRNDSAAATSTFKKTDSMEMFEQIRRQFISEQPTAKPAGQLKSESAISPERQTLKNYGNALGAIIKKYQDKIFAGGDTFNQAIEKAGEETLKALNELAGLYRQISARISVTETPEKVGEIHAALVKNYADLATAIETLAASAKNGKIPQESFVDYGQTALAANQATYDLMIFFKENGVIFQPEETGYVFYIP